MPSYENIHLSDELHKSETTVECVGSNENFYKVILKAGDKTIGTAELYYHEMPVPHYKVSEIYVYPDKRGKGYGSQILSSIEEKLRTENIAGLLQDVVGSYEANAKGAVGMYERRGWIPVPNRKNFYAYNMPDNIDVDVFSNSANAAKQ